MDSCVQIKIHLFDHILRLGRHLRCDFSIGIEEMLEDDIDDLLDRVCIPIAQSSDVLHVDGYDDFLLCLRLNIKDLFEGPNKLCVLCLNFIDDELCSFSWNN